MASGWSSVVTRWPVLQEHLVTAEDLDTKGRVSEAAVERWTIAARSAYFARCPRLHKLQGRSRVELQPRAVRAPPGAYLGRPTTVVVTANVPEVRSRSFVIAVRIRPMGGNSHVPVDAAWMIRLVDLASGQVCDISDDVRKELIALERSAEHFN